MAIEIIIFEAKINSRTILILLFYLCNVLLFAQGKVYFVIGSDTGIWDGLDVKKHIHHYNSDLYKSPARNAANVIDPLFRNSMTDSYGNPLKLTWWMMAGNTFRYADNTDVPNANSIVFYLMKKYHGENIKLLGDELSLHYHTFTWTDYDEDGKFWWNQALTYEEYADDFQFTLAQLLIDENIFPVSFRSGWHYMDNKWQNHLENILPFSLHNDYPNKHIDNIEPLDNLHDWSQASSKFVPYRVSSDNYQLSGSLKGYNVRSVYTKRFSENISNQVFQNAANGIDQVICIWSHLPENDFLDQLVRVDSIIQKSAISYSDVKFEYCTGVEAYQKWLKTIDNKSPELNLTYDENEDKIFFNINTDEEIFQTVPFVAIKNIYEKYSILPCTKISSNSWKTSEPVDKKYLAKVSVAVTDTSGNLTTKSIEFQADDKFIDNNDKEYKELSGNWNKSLDASWAEDSRIVNLNAGDSAKVSWEINVAKTTNYNIFTQIPEIDNPVSDIIINLINNQDTLFSKAYKNTITLNKWEYLTTALLDSSLKYFLEITAFETGGSNSSFASDVIKISPLVKDKAISIITNEVNFGNVILNDTAEVMLEIKNNGINPLTISSIHSYSSKIISTNNFPIIVSSMSNENISLKIFSDKIGIISDSLIIMSDDILNPRLSVSCNADIVYPFIITDNDDNENYSEEGNWATSVTEAYGNSSRYSVLNQTPLASAKFTTEMEYSGLYDILVIFPETVNSSDNALYTLSINGNVSESIIIDQNEVGGSWSILFNSYLPKNIPISVKVEDTGKSTVGPVLRSDAIKFQLIMETTEVSSLESNSLPTQYSLEQNYPNPFNPSTKINYRLKNNEFVSLKIYDVLGRIVTTLVNENQKAGFYTINLDANEFSSGVYFYRLEAGKFFDTKKMILLR